jgi:alkylhydroperoxidase family enzyme
MSAWIRRIDDDEAEADLAAAYRRMADPAEGRVDEILKIHSLHPAGLEAHYALYRAVMRGTRGLPKVDRELIALTVSQINACHY